MLNRDGVQYACVWVGEKLSLQVTHQLGCDASGGVGERWVLRDAEQVSPTAATPRDLQLLVALCWTRAAASCT